MSDAATVPRYASVDIGTNTAKLLIAEPRDGILQPVFQRIEAPRVGRNVAATGRISDGAFAALASVLESYAGEIRAAGALLAGAVATQAFRMAANGPELLARIPGILGCEARIIAGPEEARLGWLAVANRHRFPDLAVLDIGGGSTEAVRKGTGVSIPIGAVGLLEACGLDAAACRAQAARAFAGCVPWEGPIRLAAVGGTATALAMLELGLARVDSEAIEGLEVSLEKIASWIEHLAALDREALLSLPGLGEGRADIVMPGLCLLEAFLREARLDRVLVSDRGIRYGLLIDWLLRRRKASA
jgi:exopolyphosphatase/guanosine-5'-triphosphate,3'-diphosphate pyrophosphatase